MRLTELDLEGNLFDSGPLPASYGNSLFNLRKLAIGNPDVLNPSFTGNIPFEVRGVGAVYRACGRAGGHACGRGRERLPSILQVFRWLPPSGGHAQVFYNMVYLAVTALRQL